MAGHRGRIGTAIAVLLLLSACGDNNRLSLDARPVPPDEFLITPQKPLQAPPAGAELPVPTPGAANLSDIDPEVRLARTLGTGATRRGGGDGALIAAARAGADIHPDIRAILAREDAAERERRAARLEDLAEDRRAGQFYRDMLLDAYAEWARLRALGVKVPAAPPKAGS